MTPQPEVGLAQRELLRASEYWAFSSSRLQLPSLLVSPLGQLMVSQRIISSPLGHWAHDWALRLVLPAINKRKRIKIETKVLDFSDINLKK